MQRGKRDSRYSRKNKSLRKTMQLPAQNHQGELCTSFCTLLQELYLSIYQRQTQMPKCSSEDKCQLVLPSLHLPYLIYPSMHWYSAQQGPSMPRFCVQASLFNNPQKQKHFRKKCKLKGPNHLTLPACSLHAVPFNDSLDQSGDGREKEKRACSHFSLYRHEIVVKALLSVWGGGEACGHCCF